MSTSQKAQSPAATGLSEDEETIASQKREATLAALFALRGAELHRTRRGGFTVSLPGRAAHFLDIDSLENFARRMEAEQ